ncbi:uncharacterized protein SPPG_07301 [Spizellomyces punctatus DAOM BR117]|uniref:Uncharacterized protein n=1 Tax=Spizellomyces punctatus (strain DAOM BR117) TaxID=645134 RepID=A0A0L0H8V7_SPIPD|nr:uncharacterized protein SPPG_07301 [Spizellomyces punctatus DAOM BR117]KNC97374.1 hypothetical protein SPPG_07301 [Spizellomyces punctatus DAOM BR117]|eukprot:XP_016605414.1 hypothetical protein SPPG_07301 [Spizellomyces punctatus DAOM BR117]
MAASIPAALFGSAAQRGSGALVEFRAGKCTREGTLVKPDTRKGLIYMNQGDDSLMHFYWKDRRTGAVEDDLIIFPEEADFVKVSQSNGRVYVLKFKSSSQKLFFWMQEPKSDKDEELARKVNNLINNPPAPGQDPMENDLLQVLQQSARNAGSSEGATTPSSASASAQLEQIRDVLANIRVSDAEAESAGDLAHALNPDTVGPILNNPNISSALFPNLPQIANRSPAEIQALMDSPEFTQSVQSLSAALRSGQLAPLLQQLAPGSDMEALQTFLQSVQDRINQDQSGGDSMDTD